MRAILVLVFLLGIAAITQGSTIDYLELEWESFKIEFNKMYNDESEEYLRMLIFQDNKKIINAHNERWIAGDECYEMGVNQFTDMLPEEISKDIGGTDDTYETEDWQIESHDYLRANKKLNLQLPAKVNWTQMGAVSPVVNQGHFNHSWAFAAAGVVESRNFIKGHKLNVLSKQNLIDCCHKYRFTWYALYCIKQMKGIDTEDSYPYRGPAGKCRFNKKTVGAKIQKVFHVKSGNETLLASTVVEGPVAATISQFAIRNYKSGVFNHPQCGQSPDFAVLIVGYGTCPRCGDYWIIKTSLGTSWGEKGYMKLARNKNNLCGITNNLSYPRL